MIPKTLFARTLSDIDRWLNNLSRQDFEVKREGSLTKLHQCVFKMENVTKTCVFAKCLRIYGQKNKVTSNLKRICSVSNILEHIYIYIQCAILANNWSLAIRCRNCHIYLSLFRFYAGNLNQHNSPSTHAKTSELKCCLVWDGLCKSIQ